MITNPWERLREAASAFREKVDAVMPHEPLDELSESFTMECSRVRWERVVDARDEVLAALAACPAAPPQTDAVNDDDDDIRHAIDELCEASYAFAEADSSVDIGQCPHAALEREKQRVLVALIRRKIAEAAPPQTDPERERAIGDIRERLYRALEQGDSCAVWIATEHRGLIDEAVALMRSAPAPKPADPAPAPKPADPAPPSGWRERFDAEIESYLAHDATILKTLRDGLATLEDQVRAMREAGR